MQQELVVAPANPTTELCVYLLGPLRIERAGAAIHLPRRKVEALLAYLILHPERHTRDVLATLFWGDRTDDKARHSLRTALATLRQHLGAALVLADREQVQINPDFPLWVDLHELRAVGRTAAEVDRTNPAHLGAQLALWQGELLAGYYEDWVTAEREHYHTCLFDSLLELAQILRARSEYAQAIAVAHKVLTFDPANEHAHQHLMFCYMATGDRAAALRQYELCEAALASELDAPPMPETTALYHWIKRNNSAEPATAARITNLPIPLTSFVGRAQQMTEVKRLLNPAAPSKARLLTLLGAGGSGKTRLAIQVATDLIDRFSDGVWWVELAVLNESEQVAQAAAKALGVNAVRNQTITQAIIQFVGEKKLLLVLDNCEHLVEPAAQLVSALLSHCPNLQLLTTSRAALNIAGEMLWQVPTLALPDPLPDPQQLTLVDLLQNFECIRLFIERASTLQPAFRLTAENAQAVAEICAQLDGIPLAIELAAARVKVLPVEQIAARLTSAIGARFALLTQGSRTAQPRQQTLRAAIDWSYDLLDEAERQLFRHLAIFRGGFTLESVEQILDFRFEVLDSSVNETPPRIQNLKSPIQNSLDLLTQLVDKSLVLVEPQGGKNRYRLLETLREYALEQFPSTADRQQVQQRHAHVFLELAKQAEPELMRAGQQAWLQQLETEHANLRDALDYLLMTGADELALQLATALHRFWDYRGYVSEGRARLAKALAQRGSSTPETQAGALNAAGWLTYRQGDLEQARLYHKEALSLSEQAEAEEGMIDSLQHLAVIDMDFGNYTNAQERLEKSLRLARMLQYEPGIARALTRLGALAWDQDRINEARAYRQESLRIEQRLGNLVNIATGFLGLGDADRFLGHVEVARTQYEECLRISRLLGHKGLIGAALKSLGMLAFKQHEYEQARHFGEEALRIFREVGDKAHIGFAFSNLGDVAHTMGDINQALAYYCQCLQTMHEIGYKWPTFYALEDIAGLLSEVCQHGAAAVQFLAAANTLRQETNIAVAPEQQATYEQVVSRLRQQLGDALFAEHWQQGQKTPLDEIVTAAQRLALT